MAEGYLDQPVSEERSVYPQKGAQVYKSISPHFPHTQLPWSFWECPDRGLCTQLSRQSPHCPVMPRWLYSRTSWLVVSLAWAVRSTGPAAQRSCLSGN